MQNYDPIQAESTWRERWAQWQVYAWRPNASRAESFVIDTPPPTVSGSLHVGHIFSYTHQDFVARYRRMTGRSVFYPMGWDDNGLPTERRVQNYFNVRCDPTLPHDPTFVPSTNSEGAPRLVGRAQFIDLCRLVTAQDELAFKDLFSRVGLSVDWSLEYATIDEHCRRTSQVSFAKLFQAGAVYQVDAPTMWDVDFQTAVAQAEVEDREVQGASHILRFALEDGGELRILTTRPELLPACVAVMVHPEDERYRSLVGRQALTPLFNVPVPVLADPRADPEKGTGAVMVCTFGDVTDVHWRRDHKLPLRQILAPNGRLLPLEFGSAGWPSRDPQAAAQQYASLSGANLKQARTRIVEQLRAAGALDGEPKPLVHSVKFYEKGDRPLEFLTTRQWFVRLLDQRQALIDAGERIAWHPSFMGARYRNWVEGLNQDWCISRQRYFGVPFPIWYPIDAAGRTRYDQPILAELERMPVDPLSDAPTGYSEAQRGQPGGFCGDPDVQDTWATSSLTPQIASQWVGDPARHARLFPADVRPQSHEIIRTWAFYTIAKAWLHEATVPWHNVVISGWILDPDRKKMSKSKGNVVTPQRLLDTYSSDAVRYWAARARAGVDTAYDEEVFKVGRRLVTKLFNANRLVQGTIGAVERGEIGPGAIRAQLDLCLVERLREVIAKSTAAYEAYEWASGLEAVETFFWAEFCDDYLELVKMRAYAATLDEKRSALATLRTALSILLRLFAPTVPFITEELWSNEFASGTGRERSIHASRWPSAAELAAVPAPSDPAAYATVRAVLAEVRRVKGAEHRWMKWPVERLELSLPGPGTSGLEAALQDLCAACVVQQLSTQQAPEFAVRVVLAPEGAPSAGTSP